MTALFQHNKFHKHSEKNVTDKKTAHSICSNVSSKITAIVSANKLIISCAGGHD